MRMAQMADRGNASLVSMTRPIVKMGSAYAQADHIGAVSYMPANAQVGAFLTPDAVRNRLNLVNAKFLSLDLDITTNVPVPGTAPQQNLRQSWANFADQWRKFYSDSQGTLH